MDFIESLKLNLKRMKKQQEKEKIESINLIFSETSCLNEFVRKK